MQAFKNFLQTYVLVLLTSDVNGYFIINFFLFILIFFVLSLGFSCLAFKYLRFRAYLSILCLFNMI